MLVLVSEVVTERGVLVKPSHHNQSRVSGLVLDHEVVFSCSTECEGSSDAFSLLVSEALSSQCSNLATRGYPITKCM